MFEKIKNKIHEISTLSIPIYNQYHESNPKPIQNKLVKIDKCYDELRTLIIQEGDDKIKKIWNDFSPACKKPILKYDYNLEQWRLDIIYQINIAEPIIDYINSTNKKTTSLV